MRRQTLLFLLFTAFVKFAPAQQFEVAAISCSQFMAWTAGGVSSPRLLRLAQQRGIAFPLDAFTSATLSVAGADPGLLQNLRTLNSRTISSDPQKVAGTCSATLSRAGQQGCATGFRQVTETRLRRSR